MKTLSNTQAISTAAFALLIGVFATAYAGPGPQYWNKSAPIPSPKTQPKVACAGCKDTATAASNDRGPAGGGTRQASASIRHDCTMCGVTSEKAAHSFPVMQHSSACAQVSCCSGRAK